MRKLLDISVAALVAACDAWNVEAVEKGNRGRGTCREFIILTDEMKVVAELRVYEKTVQLLNTHKLGAPEGTQREHSWEHWVEVQEDPAAFADSILAVIAFYVKAHLDRQREALSDD